MIVYNVPGVGKLAPGTPFKMAVTVTPQEGEPYIDTISYPHNWLALAKPNDLIAVGITREVVPDPEPEPQAPTQDDYKNAVQAHLDDFARAHNYTDGVSLATYATSLIPQWKAEAEAFIAWRDAVWAHAFNELYAVLNGDRPQPTVAELLAELPTITWPEA